MAYREEKISEKTVVVYKDNKKIGSYNPQRVVLSKTRMDLVDYLIKEKGYEIIGAVMGKRRQIVYVLVKKESRN